MCPDDKLMENNNYFSEKKNILNGGWDCSVCSCEG